MTSALLKVSDWLARPIVGIGRLGAWLAIPLMGVIIFDVITRRFLVLGSTRLQETEWHLHAVLFLVCLGFAYLRDAHVRIELFRDNMAPRTRYAVELAGCLLFLIPYCFIVIYWGVEYAVRSWSYNEVSASLTGLPYRWLIKSTLVGGFALLGIAGLSVALRNFALLMGAEPPPEPEDHAGEIART